MVQLIKTTCQPSDAPAQVEKLMSEEGLLWPNGVTALRSTLAVDLQREQKRPSLAPAPKAALAEGRLHGGDQLDRRAGLGDEAEELPDVHR